LLFKLQLIRLVWLFFITLFTLFVRHFHLPFCVFWRSTRSAISGAWLCALFNSTKDLPRKKIPYSPLLRSPSYWLPMTLYFTQLFVVL